MKKVVFLLLILIQSLQAQYYWKIYDINNSGLSHVESFYQVSDSLYLLGRSLGGFPLLYLFDGDTLIVKLILPDTSGVQTGFTDIRRDSNGLFWLAGQQNGIFSFDLSDSSWQHFNTQNTNIFTDTNLRLEIDSENNIWTSTGFDGVNKMDTSNVFTHFTPLNSPLASNFVEAMASDDKGRVYLGAEGYVSRINTNGTWDNFFNPTACNGQSAFQNHPKSIFVDSLTNVLWVGTGGQGIVVFDSSGNCLNWFNPTNTSELKHTFISNIFRDSKGIIWISYLSSHNGVTKYDGTNWEYIDIPFKIDRFFEDKFEYKIWLTTESFPFICLYPDSLVSVVEESNQNILSNFTLYENYPNPFNPTTTINYELPINSKSSSLTIYNILGKEIKQWKLNSNSGEVVWNGTDNFDKSVSSGVYLYQLKTDSFQQTKKMLLVK